MRTVITGGAGFVGSHLCERFLAEGDDVVCVDNLLTGSRRNVVHLLDHPRFHFMEHNVSEPLRVDGGVDNVLHFASPASPADYLEHPIPTLKVGSLGTHNALGLARAKDARFLMASTSEVYGDPEVHPQREDYWGNVNPIGPRGCYDEAKRFAEAITMAYHRYHGVKTRIVRIFNTYGPRMRLNDGRVLPAFMGQVLRGENLTVFGEGEQTRSFCYVTDLVDGIYRLLHNAHDFAEPVNIGNPERDDRSLELAQGDPRDGPRHREPDHLQPTPPGRPQAPEARHHSRPDAARLEPDRRTRRRPETDARLLPNRALKTRIPPRIGKFFNTRLLGSAHGLVWYSGRYGIHTEPLKRLSRVDGK